MDTDKKAAWLEALRSGDFKQAKGSLIREDTYGDRRHCCLGVKADIEGIPLERRYSIIHDFYVYAVSQNVRTVTNIAEILGLADREYFKLVEMNDIAERTFDEIADWIEENL